MRSLKVTSSCIIAAMNLMSREKYIEKYYNCFRMIDCNTTDSIRSDLGKRLRNARKRAGLTQKQVAEALGITQQYVTIWERKEKSINLNLLVKLADLFNVSIDELMGGKTSMAGKKESTGPTGRLKRSFNSASELSRRQQEKISEVVDAMVSVRKK